MLIVLYEEEAEQELIEAAGWYEERREGLGEAFIAEVARQVSRAAKAPHRFSKVPSQKHVDHPIRRAVLKRFPYVIVFVELDDELRVLAVAHAKRKPTYWARRLSD